MITDVHGTLLHGLLLELLGFRDQKNNTICQHKWAAESCSKSLFGKWDENCRSCRLKGPGSGREASYPFLQALVFRSYCNSRCNACST